MKSQCVDKYSFLFSRLHLERKCHDVKLAHDTCNRCHGGRTLSAGHRYETLISGEMLPLKN